MYYDHGNVKLARNLRKNMTPWERKLWFCFLRKYPIKFQRQKPIANYIVDFYCPSSNLVIELDGGGHYNPESEKKDRIRTENIEKNGIMVLRFCNADIDKNFYEVCSLINRVSKERFTGNKETLASLFEGGGTA